MELQREEDHDSAKTEPLDYEPQVSVLQHTQWSEPSRYGSPESCSHMAEIQV